MDIAPQDWEHAIRQKARQLKQEHKLYWRLKAPSRRSNKLRMV